MARRLEQWRQSGPRSVDPFSTRRVAPVGEALHATERGRKRHGVTMQTTALVDEAYLRLIYARNVQWESGARFFAIAARLARRILVDYGRSRNYVKRSGCRWRKRRSSLLSAPQTWSRSTTRSTQGPKLTNERAGRWSCASSAG